MEQRTIELTFSSNYAIARKRFRKLARRSGAQLYSLLIEGQGPWGVPLTTDIAWFGPVNAERIVIHTCGVHGVEAFAGSAMQLQWIQRASGELPENTAVVLEIGRAHV